MPDNKTNGRDNQRRRTRKDLLQAASRLLKEGRKPTMDNIAEEAMVSRATAYRYFPNLERLLVEAPLDGAVPDAAALFAGDRSTDPAERVDKAEAALHEMCYRNEAQLRLMLANTLIDQAQAEGSLPKRQNRRADLIAAALAPARASFSKNNYTRLVAALSLIFGTESMIVFRDVLPLQSSEARRVKSWAVRALIEAALRDSKRKS